MVKVGSKMAEFSAARETDSIGHDDTVAIVQVPAGPCGAPDVLIGGVRAAHVYCTAQCNGIYSGGRKHPEPPKPSIMISGAAMVLIHGVPANRTMASGDSTDCGAHVIFPGEPSVLIGGPSEDPASAKCLARTLMKAGGHGTLEDCDLVAAEMGKLPANVVQRFRDNHVDIVACRGSITDYRTELKGVRPRGWPPDATWDDVPGVGGVHECVVAITGHDSRIGPHVPVTGEGHGSANLVIHESFHSLDFSTGHPSSNDDGFSSARGCDGATLSPYESQAGEAGQQETFAESAARYYGGDESDAKDHPSLHSYWESDPLKAKP